MGSHARRTSSSVRLRLVRAGVVTTVAGAVLGTGGLAVANADANADATSSADDCARFGSAPLSTDGSSDSSDAPDDNSSSVRGALRGVASALCPVKNLQLDPLAGTGVDPVDNGVGAQVADFEPIGTQGLTSPVAGGASLSELPVVGPLTNLLPG
jgi:hypothetical protein